MNREEHMAVRQQWTSVLNAVEAAKRGILDQLDVLGELAIAAQRSREPVGYDLECSVESMRAQLTLLDAQLAALLRGQTAEPIPADHESAVPVG